MAGGESRSSPKFPVGDGTVLSQGEGSSRSDGAGWLRLLPRHGALGRKDLANFVVRSSSRELEKAGNESGRKVSYLPSELGWRRGFNALGRGPRST